MDGKSFLLLALIGFLLILPWLVGLNVKGEQEQVQSGTVKETGPADHDLINRRDAYLYKSGIDYDAASVFILAEELRLIRKQLELLNGIL